MATATFPFSRAPYWFGLLLLVALIGFYPSYFSRLGDTDLAHHFHGITGTAWMLLLIAQAWLMRSRRFAVHRQLGWLSLLIAPLFVASGLLMMRTMLASDDGFNRAFGSRLAVVDLATVIGFALAVSMALKHRRTREKHACWMVSTAVMLLPPALARLLPMLPLGVASFEGAFHTSMVVSELIVFALLVNDWRRFGKPSTPFLCLLAVVAISHAGFVLAPQIPAWQAFAAWYGGR